jgi:hypothetical protein
MIRSSALFVSAAMLLAACSSVEPKAVPAKIKPAVGLQASCDDVLTAHILFGNADQRRGSRRRQGRALGPYYWCAAITDDVAEKVLGTKEAIRVVSGKFNCQIAVSKKSGLDNTLSIYLSPYKGGNAAYDWFVEPNLLVVDHAAYTIEIPGHGSAWNVELRRSSYDGRTPFTADYDDADRKVLVAADALMAYDRT